MHVPPLARVSPLVLLALSAGAAHAQTTLYELPGAAAGDRFGAAVAATHDVDGDGVDDLLVGGPGGWSGNGYARVVSGATGVAVRFFNGSTPGGLFGAALAAGDVNSDGRDDLVVGAPLAGPGGRGTVTVFDGLSGQPLWSLTGDDPGDHLGFALACVGDLDGDFLDDLAISAVDDDDGGPDSGSVRVVSGLDGSTLYTLHGSAPQQLLGYALCALADLDGDGHDDLAIGAPRYASPGQTSPGSVRVVSGKSGAPLFALDGKLAGDGFGRALAALADVDGDGLDELLVGAPLAAIGGYVRLHSGGAGALLQEVAGSPGDHFGAAVSSAGDVDGDGAPDLAIGAPRDDAAGTDAGSLSLVSTGSGLLLARLEGQAPLERLGTSLGGTLDANGDGVPDLIAGAEGGASAGLSTGAARLASTRDLLLAADRHLISVSNPATLALQLDAGAAHAGQTYVLLGSLSGKAPGTFVGGLALPLNPDRYFEVTLRRAPGGPLVAPVGTLDPSGQAGASFSLPPSAPLAQLVGLTFHHAYVVLDATGQGVVVSNAVPLTLTL